MAVNFSGANVQLESTAIASAGPYSLAGWVRVTDQADYHTIWSVENAAGSSFHILQFESGTVRLALYSGGVDMLGTGPTLSEDVWWFVGLSVNASRLATVYYGTETAAALSATAQTSALVTITSPLLRVGGNQGFGEHFDGDFYAHSAWDAELVQADFEQLRRRGLPFRTANLRAFYPFHNTSTMLVDFSGGGRSLTDLPPGGTFANAANPRVSYGPGRRRLVQVASAGGTSGTVAATLAGPTAAVSGTPVVSGSVAATLAGPTCAAAGTPVVTGTVAATLAGPTLEAGQRAPALGFNAYADGLTLAEAPNNDSFSFRLWVRMDQTDNGGAQMSPFSMEDAAASQPQHTIFSVFTRLGGNAGAYEVHEDRDTGGTGGFLFTDTGHEDEWVYLCVTHSLADDRTRFYWRGEGDPTLSSDATTGLATYASAMARILVGTCDASDQNEYFIGGIAGLAIWSGRELTSGEAQADSEELHPSDLTSLWAYYPLSSDATKLLDYSGNGRNLSTIGSGSWTELADGPQVALGSLPGVSGTVAATLAGPASAASGSPVVSGSSAATVAGPTLAASGSSTVTGTASATLTGPTLSSAGTPAVTGTAAATLTGPTASASGSPVVSGSLAATLAGPTCAASGSVGDNVTGTVAATLAGPTLSAAGTPVVAGTASSTLAGPTCAAAGATVATGSLAALLVGPSLVAVGSPIVAGTASVTLAGPTLSASGTVGGGVSGTVAATLAGPTLVALGSTVITGTLAATLAGPTLSASGVVGAVTLVAHWKCDDTDAETMLDDLDTYPLTVTGSAPLVAGQVGTARRYRKSASSSEVPSNYAMGTPDAALRAVFQGEFTVALRVRHPARETGIYAHPSGAGNTWYDLLFGLQGDTTTPGLEAENPLFRMHLSSLTGHIGTAWQGAGGGAATLNYSANLSAPLAVVPVGLWSHVAVTATAEPAPSTRCTVTIYIDGEAKGSRTGRLFPRGGDNNRIYVGGIVYTASGSPVRVCALSADVDDIRVYSGAMTDAEVLAIASLPHQRIERVTLTAHYSRAALTSPRYAEAQTTSPAHSKARLT